MVKRLCPISVEAYDNHFVKGIHLSGDDIELLKITQTTESGLEMPNSMSKGELREFKTKLKKLDYLKRMILSDWVVGGPSPAVGVSSVD